MNLKVFFLILTCLIIINKPSSANPDLSEIILDTEYKKEIKINTLLSREFKVANLSGRDLRGKISIKAENPYIEKPRYEKWDLFSDPKEPVRILQGGIREDDFLNEKTYKGFSFFKDRLTVSPEFTSGMNFNTNAKNLTGSAGRTRTSASVLMIKDNPKGIIGEGRINLRLNLAGGFNPFKNETLSNINDIYSDVTGANSGVNIGKGLSTRLAFFENLNYSQKIHYHGFEWTQVYGFIDVSDYYDRNAFANDENTQFVNSTFVNNRIFLGNVSALTGLWKFRRPITSFTVCATALDPVKFDNAFSAVAEFDLSPRIKNKQGNYRIGIGAMLGRNVNDYFFHNGAEYIYFNFDQKITDNIGIFGRFGDIGVSYASKYPFFFPVETIATHKDTNPVTSESLFFKKRSKSNGFNAISDYMTANSTGSNGLPVRQSLSFGIEWDKPFKFQKSCIAAAYGRNDRIFRGSPIDSAGHPVFAFADFPNRGAEHIIELYYRHHLTKNLTITPNFQIIINKAGNRDNKISMTYGIRTFWGF